jgi:hypothetical protein
LEPGLAYVHVGPCRRAELAHAAQGFPTLGRQRASEAARSAPSGHGWAENCLPVSATVGQHQHPHPRHSQAASSAIGFLWLSAVDASRLPANSLSARSSELRVDRSWLVTRGSWLVAHDGNATGERGVRGPACDHSSQRSLRAFPLQHGRRAAGLTAAVGSDNTRIPACVSSYLPSGQPARRSPPLAAAVVVRSRRYRLLRAQSVSDEHESWKVA